MRIANLKLLASCLAALEIVVEDTEGHLDDGEFEHPDHYVMAIKIYLFNETLRRG